MMTRLNGGSRVGDDLFETALQTFLQPTSGPATKVGVLPLEVRETEDGYEIAAQIPGIDPAAVNVTWAQGTLTIEGERPTRETEARVHVSEFAVGKFRRTLRLGDRVDGEKISAGAEHGVLTILVPRAETTKPRTIEIKAT